MFSPSSPGQTSQSSWQPQCWRVWPELRTGPCDSEGCRWFVEGLAAYWADLSPTAVETQTHHSLLSFPPLHYCSENTGLTFGSRTNLCHVGDQAEGDLWEGLVQISAHDVDPGEAVPCVRVGFIQSHDVGEVGELGVLLFQANLHRVTLA